MFKMLLKAALSVLILIAASWVLGGRTQDSTNAQDKDVRKEPTEKYLVLRIGPAEAGTPAFLCKAPEGKLSVKDVLDTGLYFRRLTRLIIYSRERKIEGALEFNAVSRLSDGPGPFSDVAAGDRNPVLDGETTVYPDLDNYYMMSMPFASKLKGHRGGFVWNGPSGVSATEGWAFAGGSYVRDFEEYTKHRKRTYNENNDAWWRFKFDGAYLE